MQNANGKYAMHLSFKLAGAFNLCQGRCRLLGRLLYTACATASPLLCPLGYNLLAQISQIFGHNIGLAIDGWHVVWFIHRGPVNRRSQSLPLTF